MTPKRYRQMLETTRADLLSRASRRDVVEIERHPDPVDDGYQYVAREAAAGVSDAECRMLREIDAAIERLDNGTYSICEGCGERIPAKRLRAVPWTPFCISCAELAEQDAAIARARTACGGLLEA